MFKFTAFIFLSVVLAACATGSSALQCLCRAKYIEPVCGDDGRTYNNADVLKCVNKCQNSDVKILAYQPCSCECPTNRMLLPVCASNGETYVNPSAVTCHNRCNYPSVTILSYHRCHEDDDLLQN